VLAANPLEYYYAIKPSSSELVALETVDEKINVCQIPASILCGMQTENLIEVVLDYPLLFNILCYKNLSTGYDNLLNTFNGLKELEKRENALGSILKIYMDIDISNIVRGGVEANKEYLKLIFIEILLAKLNVISSIESNMSDKVEQVVLEKYNGKLKYPDIFGVYSDAYYSVSENVNGAKTSSDYVYTPVGSAVFVYVDTTPELTNFELLMWSYYVSINYPDATIQSNATVKYNHHSYAWYDSSSNNLMSMPSASAYMNDGSYNSNAPIIAGTIVYYGAADFSAIVLGVGPNSGGSIPPVTVISKWGTGPLVVHNIYDCPYSIGNISYWD